MHNLKGVNTFCSDVNDFFEGFDPLSNQLVWNIGVFPERIFELLSYWGTSILSLIFVCNIPLCVYFCILRYIYLYINCLFVMMLFGLLCFLYVVLAPAWLKTLLLCHITVFKLTGSKFLEEMLLHAISMSGRKLDFLNIFNVCFWDVTFKILLYHTCLVYCNKIVLMCFVLQGFEVFCSIHISNSWWIYLYLSF